MNTKKKWNEKLLKSKLNFLYVKFEEEILQQKENV